MQILRFLEKMGLNDLIEIFIFKVDSHGKPTGRCTFICNSVDSVEELVAGLRCINFGAEVTIEVCIEHSEAQD